MTDIFHPDNELFDAIALPATLVDAEGIILDVNQAFVEHARRRGVPLTREERIGRPVADFAHDGESRGYIEDVVEQVLSAGETHQLAVRQRDGSGRLFYVDIHARALRDRDGTVRGAVIMREDVTERVQRQQRQQVVARVRDGVWQMSHSGDVERVLIAVRDGLRELEVPFGDCGMNMVDDRFEPPRLHNFGMVEGGRTFYEHREFGGEATVLQFWRDKQVVYRKDLQAEDPFGEHGLVKIAGVPARSVIDVPFAQGTLAVNSIAPEAFSEPDIEILQEMAGVLSEGFRRWRDLQSLEQHARELEDRMAERHLLEEQLRQAQKMEAVGQLTAGIAHNFNNLLQGILGNVSLSLAEAPDLLKPLLEDAESAGNRAAEMVRQLMVFSRQGIQPAYEPVDVAALLRDVVDICRRTFDRRIHIQVREPRAPVQVAGSRGQLEQTLMNLLINARDALDVGATRQPSIRVSAESVTCGPDERVSGERLKPGAYVRIRVQDSGRGIDPEIRERVFEPFFTTKEVGAGTGLGLSMVYGIVHQHGGAIDCASEPEAGSTFSVYLPVMVREEKVYSEADAAPVERGAETILVIDDEEVVRRSARLMLEKFGYTVLQAAEGLEGLEVLQREGEQIDLVLLDLSMPRMSGQETLEKIRALRSDLKVVLFTGYASEEGEFEGVDGIAQKPFSGRDLVRLIRRALDA